MSTPLFINTRPMHRSLALDNLSGVRTLNLPLLAIDDLPLDNDEHAMMQAVLGGAYDALVVTSAESAKRAVNYFCDLGFTHANHLPQLSTTPIVAVGSATAQVLENYGLSVILPTTANNEGMLDLPIIAKLHQSDKVLIWRGVGGRRLLHDTLVARGVAVDAIAWYERVKPHDLADNYQHIAPLLAQNIANDSPIFMLIASQMAFEHWQSLNSPHASSIRYLTLGERLFDIVKSAHPTACVHLLDNLNPAHISECLAKLS